MQRKLRRLKSLWHRNLRPHQQQQIATQISQSSKRSSPRSRIRATTSSARRRTRRLSSTSVRRSSCSRTLEGRSITATSKPRSPRSTLTAQPVCICLTNNQVSPPIAPMSLTISIQPIRRRSIGAHTPSRSKSNLRKLPETCKLS